MGIQSSIDLPPCPVDPVEEIVIQEYVERGDQIKDLARQRAARLGVKTVTGARISEELLRLQELQDAAREMHPDLTSPESLESYRQWAKLIGDLLDPDLDDDPAADALTAA